MFPLKLQASTCLNHSARAFGHSFSTERRGPCAAQRVAPRIVEARNLPARWPASLRFARSPRPSLPASRSAATGAPVRPTRQLFPPDRRDGHEAAARPGLAGVEARDNRADWPVRTRTIPRACPSRRSSRPARLHRNPSTAPTSPHPNASRTSIHSNRRPDRPAPFPPILDVQSAASACPP